MRIKLFLFALSLSFLLGCSKEQPFLEKYYKQNQELHNQIRNSLLTFSKLNKSKGYLQKQEKPFRMSLVMYFNSAEPTIIEYDSALNINTAALHYVPWLKAPDGLMEDFRKSIYGTISFDTAQVFFRYKTDKSEMFARDVSYIGILTPATKISDKKKDKVISADAIITSRYGY